MSYKDCNEPKLLLDHYNDKLQGLVEETNQRRAKGKPESQKDIDRYQRNIDKLKAAQEAYDKAKTTVIAACEQQLDGAKDKVNGHMKMMLQFTQAFYTKAYSAVGGTLTPPLEELEK